MGDKTIYLVQEIDGLLDLALSAIGNLPLPLRKQYEVTAVAIHLQLRLGKCADEGGALFLGDDAAPTRSWFN